MRQVVDRIPPREESRMRERLERLILLQIGAAAATRDRIDQAVSELVEQGRIEREEGKGVVEDVMRRARERSGGARGLVETSLQQGLRGAGVPNRDDYEDLIFRVEQLEHRLRVLESERDPASAAAPGATGAAGGGVAGEDSPPPGL
jgi:polyhydroxyalkanoate synthesis regulator phasin